MCIGSQCSTCWRNLALNEPVAQRDQLSGIGTECFCRTGTFGCLRGSALWRPRCHGVHPVLRSTRQHLPSHIPLLDPTADRAAAGGRLSIKESEVRARSSTTGCPQPSAPYFFPGSRAPSGVGVKPDRRHPQHHDHRPVPHARPPADSHHTGWAPSVAMSTFFRNVMSFSCSATWLHRRANSVRSAAVKGSSLQAAAASTRRRSSATQRPSRPSFNPSSEQPRRSYVWNQSPDGQLRPCIRS